MTEDWTVETLRIHLTALLDTALKDRDAYRQAQDAAATATAARVERQVRDLVETARREADAQSHAQATAIAKSEAATEKRFTGINEFRAQLSDQAATFITRHEYETAHRAVTESIGSVGDRLTTIEASASGQREARANTGQWYGWMVAGLSFLISLILLLRLIAGAG